MNLSHLRYFVKLAELGSYTEAAKALFITQPALSSAMKALEQETGFPLVEKDGRGVRLTREGRMFRRRIEAALLEIDRGLAEGRMHSSGERAIIKVGVGGADRARCLMTFAREFRRDSFPGVHFETLVMDEGSLSDALKDGAVDAAVLLDDPHDGLLESSQIVPSFLAVCTARPLPLAAGKGEASLADVRGLPLLTYYEKAPFASRVGDWAEKEGLRVIGDYEDDETLMSMVKAGGQAAALLVVPHRWEGAAAFGLSSVLLDIDQSPFFLYLACRRGTPPDGPLGRFVRYLGVRSSELRRPMGRDSACGAESGWRAGR